MNVSAGLFIIRFHGFRLHMRTRVPETRCSIMLEVQA